MQLGIEERITAIEARNQKVETDKAWETSLTRRCFLAVVTWIAASITLGLMGVENPYLPAIVPVIGYITSTLSLPHLRNYWEKTKRKRD